MARSYSAQKAGLTKAVKSGDILRIRGEVFKAVREWEEGDGWPDAWSDWQRAYEDTCEIGAPYIDIADLA